MPRKTRLDNNRNRRREDDYLGRICDIEDMDIAMKPVLTDEAVDDLAAAIVEVVINPDKYKHLQEKS